MSRERARRRAEREAAAAAARDAHRRHTARQRARRRRRQRLTAPLRALRPARGTSRLAAERRRQDGALLAVLLAAQLALWLWTGSWWWRVAGAGLAVLAWPVLTTVLFDRRGSR